MKNKNTVFSKIIILAIVVMACIVITLTATLAIGSLDSNIFDFSNLNLYNAVPVLIIGGIISCFVIGIGVLFLSRNIFYKFKNYFFEEDGGKKE